MLHFAPRYGRAAPQLTGKPSTLPAPSNDNPANDLAIEFDEAEVLAAALRLFAAHGLSAALGAGQRAEDAARRGDESETAWWLAVCKMLDRGMARELTARHARGLWPARASR
jgi:hypothetical protein